MSLIIKGVADTDSATLRINSVEVEADQERSLPCGYCDFPALREDSNSGSVHSRCRIIHYVDYAAF